MTKLHFTAVPQAAESLADLRARYGDAGPDDAEIVVALGGDGFMLQTLHAFTGRGKPIYGMNRGTVGFLMNEYHGDDLIERLAAAERAVIHPLKMTAHSGSATVDARAFNEVSLLRETRQAAKIRILVDGKELPLPELKSLASGPALAGKVDVRGAKELTLVVDFGPTGDVQADVNWGDARLIGE